MYLDRIEIQGFKSFANKTILQFTRPGSGSVLVTGEQATDSKPGISCIVGPNGSGKSNIVDAIRWVLGEQSLKSLRGRKSDDVIFAGSDKKSRLSVAEVSLHINNEDGAMPIDYKEVAIARKVYRDGESEYLINKAKVRLQDIIMLLAKSNFGQKSYSIVSQGSIDQVIMATPNERKDYFDEAVGVKQFQLKRDQSLNKLETSWNNLRQVDALLTEITPRLASLTRQVRRLEKREKVETELKAAQEKYYGWLWHDLAAKLETEEPKLKTAETSLAQKDTELRSLQDELRALEKQDSRSKVFGDLQAAYHAVMDRKNKLREEQLMLQNKIELSKQRLTQKAVPMALPDILSRLKEIISLEQKIGSNLNPTDAKGFAQAKEDLRELGRLIRELVEKLENPAVKKQVEAEVDPDLISDLTEVQGELAKLEKEVDAARTNIDEFNQQEEKKKGAFFDLQRQITKHQDDYNRLANQLSSIRVEMARLETHRQDLKRDIEEETGSFGWVKDFPAHSIDESALRSEIHSLKHQLELIGGVDPEVVKEYEEIKERHDFLSSQADDLRSSIENLEKVINDLDDQIQVQFDTAFKDINREFSKFFKILFNGGKAELVLLKEEPAEDDPEQHVAEQAEAAEEFKPSILDTLLDKEKAISPKRFLKKKTGKVITGIDIIATPPGKKVASINVLSGGERSLASIALICAVIANNPSPFVILDEVDAALDEANSQRFSKILNELAHKTQFIVITHNRATMHQANILYGVTVGDDGVSKLLSLKLEEAERVVRQ